MKVTTSMFSKYKWIYRDFCESMKSRMVEPNKKMFETERAKELGLDYDKCMKATTVLGVEEYFVRRIFGFESILDFYKA